MRDIYCSLFEDVKKRRLNLCISDEKGARIQVDISKAKHIYYNAVVIRIYRKCRKIHRILSAGIFVISAHFCYQRVLSRNIV